MRTWLLIILVAAVAAPRAGHAAGYRQRNAAYWYTEAFSRLHRLEASMPEAAMRHRLGRVTAYLHHASAPPSDALRAFLNRMDPALGMARRGATRDEHDFFLDYTKGPGIALPHLAAFRSLAKCLAADARIRLFEDDPAGAVRQLAMVYRMSEHVSRDRLVRSTLTGQSLFTVADRVTRHAVDAGAFGPSECATLLDALQRLDGRDPFRLVEAVACESRFMMPWYEARYATRSAGRAGLERFRRDFGPQIVEAQWIEALNDMTPRQLDADLAAAAEVLEQALDALRLDDVARTRAALSRLDREINDGTHGIVAANVLPGFRGMYDRMQRMLEEIASRRALLEQLADGRLDRTRTANAALWYLRAGAMLDQLGAADRDRLRAFAADPTQSIDHALTTTLHRAEPIIELLREASWIDRCDFASARPGHPSGLLAYHASMRDLVRLLQVDAVRCIRREQYGNATDRLAFALRATAHLGQDTTLISTRLAQESFESTWTLIEPGLGAELFDDAQRSKLLRSARRMTGADPFGFETSLDLERRSLRRWLRRQVPAPDAPELSRRLDTMLAACDENQVFTLALGAGWLEARRAPVAKRSDDHGGSFEGLVAAEALDTIAERLPKLRELLEAGRIEDLPEWATVSFSQLHWRGRGATKQLQQSIRELAAGS